MEIMTKSGDRTRIEPAELEEFATALRGEALQPGDAGYDSARVVFNGVFAESRPALVVRCRGVADVMDTVRFSKRHDLLAAVRGGGHNIAGTSTCDGGLVIDLSPMHGVQVDPVARTARVGGGAVWADVDRETQAFGLAAPGGIVSHTGVAGLTLNGGIGWLRSPFGMTCDNLTGAEVVTADGERIVASETENPDLLWALRGGGGNFGVVTSFEFRLHPVGPEVATVFAWYPIERAREVMLRWRDWVLEAPEEVSSEILTWRMPDWETIPDAVRGREVVIPSAVCAGDPERGMKLLEPLRTLAGKPLQEMAAPTPFRGVQTAFDAFFPNTGEIHAYWKSLYAKSCPDELVDRILELTAERSSPATMIVLQHLGAAVHRPGPDHAAFAGRGAPFVVALMASWTDAAEDDRHTAWVREATGRIAPLSTGSPYLNYLGREDAEADAVVRAAFGDAWDRLARIKAKYDPDNHFRLNQNIRPAQPGEAEKERRRA